MNWERLRRHLAGNLVAYVALFVALGGGAYAAATAGKNTVKSKSIKDGQVKTKDLGRNAVVTAKVKDGSLTATDFAPGELAGLSGYQVLERESASNSTDEKSVSIECPAGTVVLGGGAVLLGASVDTLAMDGSDPGSVGDENFWFASAHEVAPNGAGWSIDVRVICADDAP
jgi:hypothetical protein